MLDGLTAFVCMVAARRLVPAALLLASACLTSVFRCEAAPSLPLAMPGSLPQTTQAERSVAWRPLVEYAGASNRRSGC